MDYNLFWKESATYARVATNQGSRKNAELRVNLTYSPEFLQVNLLGEIPLLATLRDF